MKQMILLALVAVMIGLAGCATARPDRSRKAAASMKELNDSLALGQSQLKRVQEATSDLARAKPEELRATYERFAQEASALRDTADDAREETRSMRKNAKAYFAGWEKELNDISNGELQQMSRERRALLESEYGRISAAMSELVQAYEAYEKDVADLEKFLGNDLTRVGSELARPFLARLPGEAEAVRRALGKAQAALGHLQDVLKPK